MILDMMNIIKQDDWREGSELHGYKATLNPGISTPAILMPVRAIQDIAFNTSGGVPRIFVTNYSDADISNDDAVWVELTSDYTISPAVTAIYFSNEDSIATEIMVSVKTS